MNKKITIEADVHADMQKVWDAWNKPEHVTAWMHASDDWECQKATNDLRVGGRFSSTLAAKDGSTSFDFSGVYTQIEERKLLSYTLDDGRTVEISFLAEGGGVRVVEIFEMEHENTEELQRAGWQSILNNFKVYVEGL